MLANRHPNSALAAGIGCTLAILATPASAQSQAYVDVSVSGNAQSNPYLRTGGNSSTEAVTLQITPVFTAKDDLTSVTVRGNLRVEKFARRYSTAVAYGAGVNASRAISERVELSGRASFNSFRSSLQDIAFAPLLDTAGNVIELPLNNDPTQFGLGERIKQFGGSLGVGITLSERDRLNVESNVSAMRYEAAGLRNYNQFGQTLGYGRQLSPATSLDVTANVGYTNYQGRRDGDALIVQPMVGVRHQLSSRVNILASVGGSHARIRLPGSTYVRQTGLALSGQICDKTDQRTFCARFSRSTQPTALGEVRNQTSGGLNLDWRLTNKSSMRAGATYSRLSGTTIGTVTRPPSSIMGLFADYEHRLTKRLGLFVGTNYSGIYERGQARRGNFAVNGGLRLRIGADK